MYNLDDSLKRKFATFSVRYDFDYALEKHISKCIVGSGEFISGNSQNCNMCIIVFYQTYGNYHL